MVARCTKPNHPDFKNYGARGISVDPAWMDFDRFAADMGLKPDASYTLERKDNNRGYGPDNCIWADRKTQALNRRNNGWNRLGKKYTYNGRTMGLYKWAAEMGISPVALSARINTHGWDIERALTTPIRGWNLKPNVTSLRKPKSTQYIGVVKRAANKYTAGIVIDGRKRHIGTFDNPEVAANERDLWALRFHGPNAKLNFPDRKQPKGLDDLDLMGDIDDPSTEVLYAQMWQEAVSRSQAISA